MRRVPGEPQPPIAVDPCQAQKVLSLVNFVDVRLDAEDGFSAKFKGSLIRLAYREGCALLFLAPALSTEHSGQSDR